MAPSPATGCWRTRAASVHFLAKRRIEAGSQLEEVGKDLRSKMSWGTKVEEL